MKMIKGVQEETSSLILTKGVLHFAWDPLSFFGRTCEFRLIFMGL